MWTYTFIFIIIKKLVAYREEEDGSRPWASCSKPSLTCTVREKELKNRSRWADSYQYVAGTCRSLARKLFLRRHCRCQTGFSLMILCQRNRQGSDRYTRCASPVLECEWWMKFVPIRLMSAVDSNQFVVWQSPCLDLERGRTMGQLCFVNAEN